MFRLKTATRTVLWVVWWTAFKNFQASYFLRSVQRNPQRRYLSINLHFLTARCQYSLQLPDGSRNFMDIPMPPGLGRVMSDVAIFIHREQHYTHLLLLPAMMRHSAHHSPSTVHGRNTPLVQLESPPEARPSADNRLCSTHTE